MVEVWVSCGGALLTGVVPSEEATWDPDSDAWRLSRLQHYQET